MTLTALRNDLYKLEEIKPKDYWRERSEMPLFSKKPFDDYEDEIPDKDVFTVNITPSYKNAQQRNPFNCLVCASTGVGKTRLVKNFVKHFYKQDYKILFIEPKSIEMYNARNMGQGKKIHHLDMNEKLPIICYAPNYSKSIVQQNFPYMMKKINFYSPTIANLNYREIWHSFGISDKAADMIVSLIKKGIYDIKKFRSTIISDPHLHIATKNASLAALNNMEGTGFFASNKKLDLFKEWDINKNILVLNYFSQDGAFMNTDIGLLIDLIRDYSLKEMAGKGLDGISKKLIVFDDAFYYAGFSAIKAKMGGVNLAIRNIQNCQNNFRSWGIDTMFIVQSPDSNAIMPALIDGCTSKLISYTENPDALRGKLPRQAFDLLANTDSNRPMLYTDEDNYTFQWIFVKGKTRWITGFPFDCTVGHS